MVIKYQNINTNKFHDELIASGINPLLVQSRDNETWVTYPEKTDIKAVDAIVAAHNPSLTEPEPTETELMQAEIISLKSRLAKVEAVPIVKATLEPVIIKDPIISK